MNFKRILSSALTVVILFGTVVGLIPMEAEAASSSVVTGSSDLSVDAVKQIVTDSYSYGSGEFDFDSAAELLEYELALGYLDYVSSAGNKYTLYINRYTGMGYYVNNATGEILTTNPYNPAVGGTSGASDDTIKRLMSQIEISFGELSNSAKTTNYLSTVWAAEYKQIAVSPISGGLRVSYTLGDTTARFLVPGQITAERFDSQFIVPMLQKYEEMIEDYTGDTIVGDPEKDIYLLDGDTWEGDPVYVNGCLDRKVLYDYLSTTKRWYQAQFGKYDAEKVALDNISNNINRFVRKYALKNPVGAKDKELEKMYVEAPLTKEGIAVCVFLGDSVSDKRIYSNIIRSYCPDYTFKEMYDDETLCGFVFEADQKPVFRCSLEYTFNSDGSLSVRLPANSISFDETVYTLKSITPVPFFGCGNLAESGYAFIPDGSGSVIKFDEFYTAKQKQNVSLELLIYGSDYCYSKVTGAHREPVSMPVYGIVGKVNATPYTKSITGKDMVDGGYFAILEEGASLANLKLNFGGMQHSFATVNTSFTPYPSDKYDLSDTISVGGAGEYTIVSESKYTGSYVTRYVMLSDIEASVAAGVDSYAPTYVGMASYYRDYLKSRGELTSLKDLDENLPLYIEALGSMEIVKKIMTFPVTVSLPLTTFEDVVTMYDEFAAAKDKLSEKSEEYQALADQEEKNMLLKEQYQDKAVRYAALAQEVDNITNVKFRLTGFANGGMYFTYPSRVKWEKVCGGKRGISDLVTEVGKRNENGGAFEVYPEFDFLYMSNTATFDGISSNEHLARMVDNRFASKQVYNSVLAEYETFFTMIISTDMLDELYTKFQSKYSDYELGSISASTLGSDLNSNFDEDRPINREESRKYVMSLLDRMANENGYSVMVNRGNIYSVAYADHIIDICTDSSHYRYASFSIPFVGLVLHSYVNYSGGALNYSGSPDYDLLHSIENGASLYFILCYQNTNFMKDDQALNKYYGVNYENWYDKIVEYYDILNDAIGDLQSYEIVDHRILIAERVIDADEVEVNNRLLINEFVALVEEQLEGAVNAAFEEMRKDPANVGRGVKVEVDSASLTAQASDVLNMAVEELNALGFADQLNAVVTEYVTEYPGNGQNSYVVSLSEIEYSTKHNYVTDSCAEDSDYVATDYTVDNNLIAMVTYRCPETGDEVKFILNYNIYTVKVKLDASNTYTLGKYDFIRIDD